MSNNSKRISQDLEGENNTFKEDDLQNILTNIDQDTNSLGFEEVTRNGNNFVTNIVMWTDSSKTKKIFEYDFTRGGGGSSPFVTEITKKVYKRDGTTIASTITHSPTRNANQTINQIDGSNLRS